YLSVGQFSEDIRRHLEGRPVIARKDTLGYRTSKFILRNKLAVSAAAVVVLAIVAGLIIALSQAQRARRERDLAQREKVKAERINSFLQRTLSFSNKSMLSISRGSQKQEVTLNQIGRRQVSG